MITQTPWFERKFDFNFPVGIFPIVVERLRGTLLQLQLMLKNVAEEKAQHKDGEHWSIKEQIGHLYDLEELWYGRIEDFLSRKQTLRVADLSNAKTQNANHNSKTIPELLKQFSEERNKLINKVENIDEATASITALHPRLQKPMRLVDSLFFVAEHDDHHLTKIREILKAD
jgi:uncharacterized damage-inducible protein DinB